ncbi:MAG: hypothetical protein AB1631_19630 [Acidobacteriota bacterium]
MTTTTAGHRDDSIGMMIAVAMAAGDSEIVAIEMTTMMTTADGGIVAGIEMTTTMTMIADGGIGVGIGTMMTTTMIADGGIGATVASERDSS